MIRSALSRGIWMVEGAVYWADLEHVILENGMGMLKVNGYLFACVAMGFGLDSQVRVGSISGGGNAYAANVTGAGASFGFAIAAGLCFLGWAILASKATDAK